MTPLKRFEKTGATTLRNLIALLRGLNLLEGLDTLIPPADNPGPLVLLAAEKKRVQRQRAPRTPKASTAHGRHQLVEAHIWGGERAFR